MAGPLSLLFTEHFTRPVGVDFASFFLFKETTRFQIQLNAKLKRSELSETERNAMLYC